MDTFQRTLALVRAGVTVLHIASYEWQRTLGWATHFAHNELKVPLRVWSSSSGLALCDANSIIEIEDEAVDNPIEAMLRLREAPSGGVLLLEDVHPFLEPEHHQVTRWVREMARLDSKPRRLVILSTPLPGLPAELAKEVPSIDLPLPGPDVLEKMAVEVASELGLPLTPSPALFDAARGLTVMEAKLAFGQAAMRAGQLGPQCVGMVIGEKERVIRQNGVLEYYEPDAGMRDVGGLDNLKTWLERRGRAFGPGAKEFGLDAPKGALLLGVQGCGKSLVAKAIASSWQFPLLRFDLGKVFGGIVGQSEGNVRSALQTAQALAPCVLWIDEIEKGLAGTGSSDSTDGGTTARVVGTLLTWMQEKREPVFVVATANRIEMLPPELLRKGRFDEIFFVDLPTLRVRREIFAIHLHKKSRAARDFDLDALVEASEGFSGAEIEEAVHEGLFAAFAEGRELRDEHIVEALRATYPLSSTMGSQLNDLRRWARVRARLASSEAAAAGPAQGPVPRLRQEQRNPFVPDTTPDTTPNTTIHVEEAR